MNKYLKLAERLALEHEFSPKLDYNLCAIIAKGGRILSTGFNKHPTNGFVEHYANLARGSGRDYCMSTHAELDAICSARNKIDLNDTKIYVARIKKSGGVGMARPCKICVTALQGYGIKKAYYTIDENYYGVMKPGFNCDKLYNAY